MPRPVRFVVFALVCGAAAPVLADDDAPAKVTESDYATMRKLEYAKALLSARTMYDRANTPRHEADEKKSFRDAGWTNERYDEVRSVLSSVQQTISGFEAKEIEKADFDATMAEYDKTTVATVKAHLNEIAENVSPSAQAEAQARAERDGAKKGTPVTAAGIQGTWVIDIDGSMERILGSAAAGDAVAKLKKDLEGTGFQFGPGDAVVATSKNPDGTPKLEKGVFRVDGGVIVISAPGSKRESKLEAGMDPKGRLILGSGLMGMLYKKK